ncbi:MAG: ribosome small subunit-dependent GTPase A [Clostridia bacterium]|nr:ribosome small subunit-dependent GTPase A [Clostridia bacterium]MBR0407121.1 ribosome small subunit-dependent GTPase A [Clostridia bacterium]
MMQGVIVRGRGGFYTVRDEAGQEFVLRAKKKFRRQKISPLVGDRVLFTPGEGKEEGKEEDGWVEEILPRQSQCLRPPVANVTLLCIVVAPTPEPDWMLVDKLLIFAQKQRIRPVLILNKGDLPRAEETAALARAMYAGANLNVLAVSAQSGQGVDGLKAYLSGGVCCFSGQSGVGKSTLLNALFGLSQETGDISRKIQRGKNTTRHAELFTFGDISVIDTPGFSLLELDEVFDPVLLRDYYPEFEPYVGACRFSPCYHGSEPGCAVLKAAKDGAIHPARLERYHALLADCRQAWRERYD